MTAEIPHPYPAGEAERFVLQSRADNACGRGLVLAITQKGAARTVIGIVAAHADQTADIEIGYAVAPAYWGKGNRDRGREGAGRHRVSRDQGG